MIQLERAYNAESRTDGPQFRLERLWPRAVKKSSLRGALSQHFLLTFAPTLIDSWLKPLRISF